MRSISAFTTSLGISTRTFFRVSLTSTNSVFMDVCLAAFRLAFAHGGLALGQGRVDGASPSLAATPERSLRVRKGGVEPPKPCGYRILSPARLPVPPLSRKSGKVRVARELRLGDNLGL